MVAPLPAPLVEGQTMTAYLLEPVLDTAAASPLRERLLVSLQLRRPVALDGSQVERVGQACLQILAGARAAAEQAGIGFAINDPSIAFGDMVRLSRLDAVLEPVA